MQYMWHMQQGFEPQVRKDISKMSKNKSLDFRSRLGAIFNSILILFEF